MDANVVEAQLRALAGITVIVSLLGMLVIGVPFVTGLGGGDSANRFHLVVVDQDDT